MPRPSTLPTIDWQQVFSSGRSWTEWLASAENPENAGRMQARVNAMALAEDCCSQVASVSRSVYVVAIAEDWCGDVIRHAPVLERIVQHQPKVQVRYITRTDHPDVFARFLTNGGEAIPKFIFLSENWVECGNWGPMQADCRKIIARGKACGDVAAARSIVSEIYQNDPGCNGVFKELCELAELAAAEAVEQ